MAVIPEHLRFSSLTKKLIDGGLVLRHQGKVWDSFEIPNEPDLYLNVASDRVSAYDYSLGMEISKKGEVLTGLTVFWDRILDMEGIQTHLIAYGSDIDLYLDNENLHKDPELQRRALIIKRQEMLPIEAIVRGHLTGSGWSSYQETGRVCGHHLDLGLDNGDRLLPPLFTPTTKALAGHDEHMDYRDVEQSIGSLAIKIYNIAYQHAIQRQIIIADTKFEFSKNLVLCDEYFTTDTSRYWRYYDWEHRKPGKSPIGFDKQILREYLKTVMLPGGIVGLDHPSLDPTNPDHIKVAADIALPDEVLEAVSFGYQTILGIIADMSLQTLQRDILRVIPSIDDIV